MTGGQPSWRAVAARAASLLLRYPDEGVLAAVPTIVAALPGLPDHVAQPLGLVADHRARTGAAELQASYVELFDLQRRCCLYLSWYAAGDTRRRGEALVGFADAYRAAGLRVTDEELPDFLPAVLDLAAHPAAHHDHAWRLLREHRAGLETLADALRSRKSVYQHAVRAVVQMLPPARPGELASATHPAHNDPPQELVGLEPYGALR